MALPVKSVLDGAGALTTVNTLASGRNAAVDSAGVVLSTEDLAQLAAIVTAVNAVATATGIAPVLAQGTRIYSEANSILQAVGVASTAAITLPTLGTTREIRLNTTARIYIRFGVAGVGAASAASASIPFDPGTETIQIAPTFTHFRVIRDTADGTLNLTPVA